MPTGLDKYSIRLQVDLRGLVDDDVETLTYAFRHWSRIDHLAGHGLDRQACEGMARAIVNAWELDIVEMITACFEQLRYQQPELPF